jgi:hypothetical protein
MTVFCFPQNILKGNAGANLEHQLNKKNHLLRLYRSTPDTQWVFIKTKKFSRKMHAEYTGEHGLKKTKL